MIPFKTIPGANEMVTGIPTEQVLCCYLDGKAVAVERGLQVLIKAWGLECTALPLGEQEEAGGVGQRQGLPRGIEQGLLTPTQRRWWVNARHLASGSKYGSSSEIRSCG